METDSAPITNLLKIHCEAAAKLNFACHQNDFAVLRDLRIENLSPEDAQDDLLVTLESDPAFLANKAVQVDRIAAGATTSIRFDDLALNGEFLLGLEEAVKGTLSIKVERQGELLVEHSQPIELLARNEWGGAGSMPELLAAFCMPNDPAVDRILHAASETLRRAGKPDAIDGYRSGSRQRVWEIASAIYSAVANLGLKYALPPTSFETNGQKIRIPSRLIEGRVATCLDSALLLAAAFEQAGLNPIIALLEDHALVGVWLQPERLASVTNDEAEVLRKRYQLKELVLVESTLLTTHPPVPFSRAIERAVAQLDPEFDERFVTAVDIARARAHQITPIGVSTEAINTSADGAPTTEVELALEQAPALPDFDQEEEEEKPQTPAGRLDRWQRKLLDLSARNPLLNHKSPKTSLELLCPDPGRLEDKLASGKKISIAPIPTASGQSQDQAIHERRTGQRIDEKYASDALDQNQVLVGLPKQELDKRLVEVYRKTQTSLQEGGANTLYLALGFLLWKREESDSRRFRAPLILMPIALQRKSVRSGVKMHAHDDEPRFNTTLLEMLRKDYGIEIGDLEHNLPEDEHGVDVHEVWTRVRKAVKDAPGFEVVEDVVLGHFSFAKYLMWKDLVDRTDDLRKSSVVKHLIDSPRDPYLSEASFVSKEELDRDFHPSDFLTPLPADSSQMAAIASAEREKDFIIIGPPGTGKSQTISNMIAHLLGKGKSVLFVSEKTAALDVVHRRLEAIGLGRFCLQLHSNKARKAEVLAQLKDAWDTGTSRTGEAWNAEADRLGKLRDRLNVVVEHLHRRHRNGLTAHHAIGIKVRDSHLVDCVELDWPSADHHSEDQLQTVREAVVNLQIQAREVGPFDESPFQIIAHGEWSPTWQKSVRSSAAQLATASANATGARARLLAALQLDLSDQSMRGIEALEDLCGTLLDAHRKQVAHALEVDGPDRIDALEQAVDHLKAYASAQSRLSCPYESMAWRSLDGEAIDTRWSEAQEFWFLKRALTKRKIVKEMRSGGAKGKPNPKKDAKALAEMRIHGEAIDRLDRTLSSLRAWDAHESNPETLADHQDVASHIRRDLARIAQNLDQRTEIGSALGKLLEEGNDLLAPDGSVGLAATEFRRSVQELRDACAEFESAGDRDLREYFLESPDALIEIQNTAKQIVERDAELKTWCDWQLRRGQAVELDLGPFVEAIESGNVQIEDIPATFEAAYCSWWSSRLFDEDEVLRTFSSAEHADAITQFRAADEAFLRTTARYVSALLSQGIPGQGDVPRTSQWGLLKREITKRTRHLPIRQLMQDASSAVTRLAPCLMMSPLSVAQYLPPDQALFDVVIFDEASQITVWDAVGAIARGSQVVVAGDPKQMPPSNFFGRSEDDADGDIDFEGDMESILDELRSSNIPELTLNLHYRSRRESLIAFSNNRYYDNGLVTFPAPVHPDKGLRLVCPNGHYDRGKSRTNRGEAEAIVQEIVQRLQSEDPSIRDRTLGVVTFNSEQQSLIQDLLDHARSSHPEIEWAFAEDKIEPVFVKNLETVQGDERDVILFSVTYGPDAADHLTMNFGPLNKQGGERRLNVALTRARSEMIVFSTLESERIDLSRTSARAVADLKHFLEFAKRGPSALAAAVHGSLGDFESPFEAAVASGLRERGWIVQPQIGVSAFRVDLGIVHPDKPGRFLAGVECDGAMYHSSAFARERDKIRQSVLEGLGWTLLRVWSTDWWLDKAGALDKLDQGLKSILDQGHEQVELNEAPVPPAYIEPVPELKRVASPAAAAAPEAVPHNAYVFADIQIDPRGDELGTMPSAELTSPLARVVAVEAPMHEDDLIRRLTLAAGLHRAGARIAENVLRAVELATNQGIIDRRGSFLWRPGQMDVAVRDRSSFAPNEKKFDRIAPEEVREALLLVVRKNFSLSQHDAISEAAESLGFLRVTAAMKTGFLEALENLTERRFIERNEDRLFAIEQS